MTSGPEPTPQQRLAISRRALVEQFQGTGERRNHHPGRPGRPPRRSLVDSVPWGPMARSMAQRWWRRHPVNAAGQLARPVIERYAHREPAKLVAASAAVGALFVFVRPWRLLSATALLAVLMKSSDIADVVTSLMARKTPPRR